MKSDTLTAEQAEALKMESGVVLAGAGAGKTRTLIAKILHDQESGIRPDRQIVVTFTNNAANEMRHRLESAGGKSPRHLGTLHRLAMRSIMKDGNNLTVIDDKAFEAIIRQVCKVARVNAPVSQVKGWLAEMPTSGAGKLIARAVLADMVKSKRQIHPDVMLPLFLTDLTNQPGDSDFRVYVDEAQDGAAIDFAIYEAISRTGGLILFGDPRQAIYGFRGADVGIFLDRIKSFQGRDGRRVDLTTNFRSDEAIIDEANAIADQMGFPVFDMEPGPAAGDGDVHGAVFSSSEQEILSIMPSIREAMGRGQSVAVLSRYNATTRAAADMLRAEGIQVEQPGLETASNPGIDALKAMTAIPASWSSAMASRGVPFALQDRLAGALAALDDILGLPAAIDEALGLPSGQEGRVWLSTIHGSKGLEWDVVFLIAADNKALNPDDPENVRLAYVAATRARRKLTVTAARNRIAERRLDGLEMSPIFDR